MEILNLIQEYAHILWSDPDYLWAKKVLILSLCSLVVWGAWQKLHARLRGAVKLKRFSGNGPLVKAIKLPVTIMIWCWPGVESLSLILEHLTDIPFQFLDQIKSTGTVLIVIWSMYRFVCFAESQNLENKKFDQTTIMAMGKIGRFMVITVGSLTLLQAFGMSLSGLLTFGGIGGLITGFAAQDLLSNFFGGLIIYFDKPFKVGDWVRSPDRELEGTVEDIGMRVIVIRTFDKRPLYIPNSVFSSIVVENPSRMSHRRINETISIRYDDMQKVRALIADVKEMLENHSGIATNQTLMVNLDNFGDSSLDFFIYTFTKTTNWIAYHEIKQDVLLKIGDIIERHGAEIAYPTHRVQGIALEPTQFSSSA